MPSPSVTNTEEQKSPLGQVLVVVLVGAFLAYANTLDGDWVWDDASSVLLHKHVQDPAKFFQLFREDQHAFGRGSGNFYRPLVAASFMLDYVLSGGLPPTLQPEDHSVYPPTFLFHVTNILWHAAAAFCVFLLLKTLGAPLWVCWSTTLLFLLHPFHTEAVAYISGRADMMAAVGVLVSLVAACKALGAASPKIMGAWTAISFFAFIFGLLSKEAATITIVLAPLLLFYYRWVIRSDFERRALSAPPVSRAFLFLGGIGALLIVYVILRTTVLRFGTSEVSVTAPLSRRLIETFQALAIYVAKLFVPVRLHMEYTLSDTPGWVAIPGVAFFAIFVTLCFFAIRKQNFRLALAVAWFLATWLPISGIFPLNAPMAEHWMYLPMVGFWWACSEIAYACLLRVPAVSAVVYAGLALCLLFFLAQTVRRNNDWDNNERLYRATLAANPNSFRVHFNLAVTYEDLLKNLPGARRHYEEALRLLPQPDSKSLSPALAEPWLETTLSLARVYYALGDYRRAVSFYNAVFSVLPKELSQNPLWAESVWGLGRAWLALGDITNAQNYLGILMEKLPDQRPIVRALMQGAPLR